MPLPDFPFKDSLDKNKALQSVGRRWRFRQHLEKEFWKRWKKEYLIQLSQYNDVRAGRSQARAPLSVGDIVLINDDSMLTRTMWTMGRISELHEGRDGKVRSATVRTSRATLRRPVQRLYVLEAADDTVH